MSLIVHAEQSAHWYHLDGTPCHQVLKADMKGMRPTTVKDAKKLGLVPSVSSILSVIAKPGLVNWQIEMGIVAALTLPQMTGETLDEFAHRVALDSRQQVSQAADLGTDVHDACEQYLRSGLIPVRPDIKSLFIPAKEWLDENVEEVYELEFTVVNKEEKYAGRVDVGMKLKGVGKTIGDFKTQRIRNGKANLYDSFPLQLSGYRICRPEYTDIVSIIISSQEQLPVTVKVWERENIPKYEEAFRAAHTLWKYTKNLL